MPAKADSVRVTTFVAVSPNDAFEVFTEETDLWWKKSPRFRVGGATSGVLAFEGAKGGRLFERLADGTEHEVGRILVWEPGARLVFEWRGVNFAPEERTEVEVAFASKGEGTEVVLVHRGWSSIRPDHPARHGTEGRAFVTLIGLFWGQLLTFYRERADDDARPG
jgi:uncharacterized protein YndB with AHSA1/START domain